MTNTIDAACLSEGFVAFFETLHRAVTGSRKIAQFDNFALYEEIVPLKGNVYFYFFHGSAEERKNFFPEERESFGTFKDSHSTLIVLSDDGRQEFDCAFGYVLHLEEILKEFQSSDKSEACAEWIAVQILSHEIRHEIQLCHSLPSSEFRTNFPFTETSLSNDFTWGDMQNSLENLYQDYVEKERDEETLISERDAIITSYLCLVKWQRECSDDEKMTQIVEIIQKEKKC